MKKLLALVLALVMMFAVCVPAFALVETKDNKTTVRDNYSQKDPVPAKLHTNTELPEGKYAYVIEIPADTEIKWGDDNTEFTYRIVKTQLNAGQRLRVNVTSADNDSNLTSEASTAKIPYIFTRYNADTDEYSPVANLNYQTDKEVITTARPRTFFITIATDAWNVPLAEYTDILNFQIDIVDAEGNVISAPAEETP